MQLRFFVGLLAVLLFSACRRDEPTRWDIDARAPIVEGRLTWSDLLADSLLSVDANNLLHIEWKDELAVFKLDTLVAIPDTTIFNSFDPPFVGGPVLIPAGNNILTRTENLVLRSNDALLREVHLSAGTLTYTVNSYVNGRVDVLYALPGMTLPSGESVALDITTESGSLNNPWSFTRSIDLSGVEVNLEGESGFSSNRMESFLQVSASENNTSDIPLMGDDSVSVAIRFSGVKVKYAKGYFGQQSRSFTETTDVAALAELQGMLSLDGVDIRLELTNNVGADFRIRPERIAAIGSQSTTELIHPILNQSINLTRASDVNGNILGQTFTFVLNDGSSNIESFLADVPQAIAFEAEFDLNPLGNVTGSNDFIYTDNAFKAELAVDIPLAFSSSGIWLSDTIDVAAFDGDLSADATLEVQFTNAFPFGLSEVSLRYLPEVGEAVALAESLQIAPGNAVSFTSTEPVITKQLISVSREQLEAMRNGGQIVFRLRFNTDNGEYVRCTGDEYIDVKAILDGSFEIKYE